jgi:hypothetical protein
MAQVNSRILVGSVLSILNNTSYLPDCYNGTRQGSFFFGPDQEINFSRIMPKGQVTVGETTTGQQTFGRPFNREKNATLVVNFYAKRGDIGSGNNLQNRDLVYHYYELIERALVNHAIMNTQVIPEEQEPVIYLQDESVYIGTQMFTFKWVEST